MVGKKGQVKATTSAFATGWNSWIRRCQGERGRDEGIATYEAPGEIDEALIGIWLVRGRRREVEADEDGLPVGGLPGG